MINIENCRVGIIEDNEDFAQLFQNYLPPSAYLPVIINNYEDALRFASDPQLPCTLDLVLCDGNLGRSPDDGAEIIALLLTHNPILKIISCRAGLQIPGTHAHISKLQFGKEVYISIIKKVLEERSDNE